LAESVRLRRAAHRLGGPPGPLRVRHDRPAAVPNKPRREFFISHDSTNDKGPHARAFSLAESVSALRVGHVVSPHLAKPRQPLVSEW
jgi:hypothetical protein